MHPFFQRLVPEPESADELLGNERDPPMVLPIELSLVRPHASHAAVASSYLTTPREWPRVDETSHPAVF